MYKTHKKDLLPGCVLFNHVAYRDYRGEFSPMFNTDEFSEYIRPGFVQLNMARSCFGVVRGMHRQDQTKIVMPIEGEIFDVVLEPETGKWCGVKLNKLNALLIPPQYAHGYMVLSANATVQYIVDKPWNQQEEETFKWNGYGINWPTQIEVITSEKDGK